jgi:predicted DCC family thiol-disulfide oxidoreductase YuxK
MTPIPADKALILFDGYCHLCSRSVQLILKFDQKKQFLFSPLSGEFGEEIKNRLAIPNTIDSIILVENDHFYIQSEAALKIASRLGGLFKLILAARILPRSWRDYLYDQIAANRFNWFGRRDNCMLPNPEDADRFL